MILRETDDLKSFVDFPFKLHENNKYFVGDLKVNIKDLLSLSHPFWDKAERKLFCVEENGKRLGQIAAIINHAYNEFHSEKICFFGFFDCINDVHASKMLFDAVEKYAREKNMTEIYGPANPSSNYTWGLLVENFNEPNVVMMPYNPEYYINLIESAGYTKKKDLYAFKWTYNEKIERFRKLVGRVSKSLIDFKIEFADLKNIEKVFEDVKYVYNRAWEKNWGFVPMSEREIEQMAKELKPILKKEYLMFGRVGDRAVSFCLILPNFNIALKVLKGRITPFNIFPFLYKYLFKLNFGRMLTLGVIDEYRGRGIEALMILKAIEVAERLGWKWGELSWTLEDNTKINKTIEKIGGVIYKKYRIYSKPL